MKIAAFTDTFYPKVDGIVTSILNFSKELVKNDHETIVFSPKYKKFKELKIKGICIHRFFSISLTSYQDIKIVLPNLIKIFRLVKKHRPDIIHIHTPGPMGYIGTLCSRIFKIPCIGTYHTLISEQMMYISLKKLLRIEKAIGKISGSKFIKFFRKRKNMPDGYDIPVLEEDIKKEKFGKRMAWRLSRFIYNKCDLIIVPSKSIKRLIKEKGIKKRTLVVSNGIDAGLFDPKKRYNKKIKKIVHVGRISFEKNADRTIKAFSLITKKYPEIKYFLIGGGPALNSLKNLVKKLKLTDQVKFLDYMPHKKLPDYYKRSDFFVTASTMETQGLVIFEAMASGLPVIGVNAFAIPDIVENGFNGFIVEPTDVKGMANYMEVLIKNPRLVEVLGKKAVLSTKLHDLRQTSLELEAAYKKLIKSKKR